MNALVLQSDFGTDDGAVSAMYGVAMCVDSNLRIFDNTHGIEPYNIMEAGFRLFQTVNYWPEGTVFVSVVDPGVGSDRRSIVVKLKNNQYVVTPDNGTITFINKKIGITEARIINETKNRRPDSNESYTFHGRDVYAFTGAKLASGKISFEEIGDKIDLDTLVELNVEKPFIDNDEVNGVIEILDVRFGSLWTNIDRELFKKINVDYGDRVIVRIIHENRTVYSNTMLFGRTFLDVSQGEALVYVNSLDTMAIAINQGSFAKAYNIGTGDSWKIKISKYKN